MATSTLTTSVSTVRKHARPLTVTMRALANSATPLSVGCFYGIAIILLLAPLYPAMTQSNFKALLQTKVMEGMLGGSVPNLNSFTAFLAMEVFSSIYGLLFGGFIAWIGGAALPITIEDGTLDLALARPLSRTRYYLENWLGVFIGTLVLVLIIMGSVWVDTLIVQNANIDWQWMWITELVQWSFLFFAGGIGMLCGACLNASRLAGGTALSIIVLGYLLNTFGGLADQFNWMLNISPFHYAPAIDPLINHQLTWWYPWLLVAIGLACGLIGLVIFNKRDLPTI